MRKLQKTKIFSITFYFLSACFLLLSGIALVFTAYYLNESYFLRFTINNKLTDTAINRITNFKALLSLTGFLILCVFLFVSMNKKAVISLIEKRKILLQNLTLLLFSILVFILLFEFAARIALPEETKYSFPVGQVNFFNEYAHLNKEGYRDIEHGTTKGTKFRIAVIGDSYTFGSGIKNINHIYPRQLERLLNIDKGRNYEVLNFGKPGVDTEFEITILKNDVVQYKPDLIIIGYVLNDFRDLESQKKSANPYLFWFGIFLKRYSYLYGFTSKGLDIALESVGLKKSYYTTIVDSFGSENNKKLNGEYFKELKNISQDHNATLIIVIFPFIYHLDNYPFAEQHKAIAQIASQSNIIAIDLLPYFKGIDENSIIVSNYDRHPNEIGHEIAAKAIYEKLININLVS